MTKKTDLWPRFYLAEVFVLLNVFLAAQPKTPTTRLGLVDLS